jgi:para-nitrobenzyl esterase
MSFRFAVLLALGLFMTTPAFAADRVRTEAGVVEGRGVRPSGVRTFFGVPFAAPPVGPLRWAPPQPVAPWRGVRPAVDFAARCMQAPIYDDMVFRSPGINEDCLYLNVWTPAKAKGEKRPVLVYLFGGGFIAGDASEPRYDGEAMAKQGVVVVTVGYRLGVFGFLAHPELTAESPNHASGNYGLLDQTAALNWVRRNIRAFGGDPDQVTLAGESAGSISVSAQMASPLARGLFARAIGESGSLLGTLPAAPMAEAERTGAAFAAKAGAASLAELRAAPAQRLLDLASAHGAPRFPATVDGWFLPKEPRQIFAAAGSNSSEGYVPAFLKDAPPTVAAYRAIVARLYGDRAEAVLAAYPAEADGQPVIDAARALSGDRFIGLSTWLWIELATRTGGEPTYYYLFDQPRPMSVADLAQPGAPGRDSAYPRPWGSGHSHEIEYVLNHLDLNPTYGWSARDYEAARLSSAYFANFIKTGDPNGAGLPVWPTYGSGQRMVLGAAPHAAPDTTAARLEVLERSGRR